MTKKERILKQEAEWRDKYKRQKVYNTRQLAKGYMLVKVWVPEKLVQSLKDFAKKLRG